MLGKLAMLAAAENSEVTETKSDSEPPPNATDESKSIHEDENSTKTKNKNETKAKKASLKALMTKVLNLNLPPLLSTYQNIT